MAISEVVLQNFLNPKGVAYYDNEYEKARTNELANDKLRFERQQANALRSAVQGFGNDQQANRQAVIGTGSHEALNTFDTQQNAQAKALLEAQKGQREAQEATDKRLNAQQAAYFNKTALIDGPEKLSAWVQGSKGMDMFDDDEIVAYTNLLQQQPERWQKILAAVRKFGSPLEKQFNEALERDKLKQKKEHDDATLVHPELRDPRLTPILDNRASLGASRSTAADNDEPDAPQPVLGLPQPSVYPWAHIGNSRDKNKVKISEFAKGTKVVEKLNDVAENEQATVSEINRFIEINRTKPTGELSDKVPLGPWLNSFSGDYATMQAITASIAPKMRVPGSGTVSDWDAKQFERATVGVEKPLEANENVARAAIARAELIADKADFMGDMLTQNKTLLGAENAWRKYLNANTLFDKTDKTGTFKLNANRVSWREWDWKRNTAKQGQPPTQPNQHTQTVTTGAAQQGPAEVTATNPNTGERVVFRNGQWVPLQ